jgi:hypothetical protein
VPYPGLRDASDSLCSRRYPSPKSNGQPWRNCAQNAPPCSQSRHRPCSHSSASFSTCYAIRYPTLGSGSRACAAAAAAIRQRRSGEARGASRSTAAACRPRRVGARPRHDLLGAPHLKPPNVLRRPSDLRRGEENVPPRLPHRDSAAAGGRAFPLPGRHWVLLRLAANSGGASAPSRSRRASTSRFTCWVTWTRSSFSHGHISASTPGGASPPDTGAPAGLVKDAWNIRLVPHYWLGVFFVLAHLATGARVS